jgi:hypothetical protein
VLLPCRQPKTGTAGTADELEQYWNVGQSLRLLGRTAFWQDDLDRAERLLQESLLWWRRANATRGPHWSLNILGAVALRRGDVALATTRVLESLALCRDSGDRKEIARCLDGLAAAATAGEDAGPRTGVVRATRLLAVADAIREEIGTPLYPVEQRPRDLVVVAARARLGEEEFAAAWAEGRALPLDRAIEEALSLADEIRATASGLAPDDLGS